MAPALVPTRSWSARVPGASPMPSTPTAAAEHAVRLQVPDTNEPPTALKDASLSKYGWKEDSDAFGMASSRRMNPSEETSRIRATDQQREQRHTRSGDEVDIDDRPVGRISLSHQEGNHLRRQPSNGGGVRGSGGTGSDDTASGSGNDSSVRQSGRSNFFFGAEYSTLKERNASHAQPGRGDKNPSGLPAGGVDSKTAALVGAACSPGDVAFHLQKLRGLTLKGKGDKQATLHDTKGSRGDDLRRGSKEDASATLRPPVGEAATTGRNNANTEGEERARRGNGKVHGEGGRVDFPEDFDDACPKGSDSDDGGKRSGGSLGTKSGSTSLLSMLSGSPRSLSTTQDSAAGSSPRTPLSDRSSDGARRSGNSSTSAAAGPTGAAAAATAAAGAAALGDSSRDSWNESNASEAQRRSPADPHLSSQLPDDEDLPSDHPTPLSSAGGSFRKPSSTRGAGASKGKGGGSALQRSISNVSNSSSRAGLTKSTKVNSKATSSTFMDRLKYWGGGLAGNPENTTKVSSTTQEDKVAAGLETENGSIESQRLNGGRRINSLGRKSGRSASSQGISPGMLASIAVTSCPVADDEGDIDASGKQQTFGSPNVAYEPPRHTTSNSEARHRPDHSSGQSTSGLAGLESTGSQTTSRGYSTASPLKGIAVTKEVATPSTTEARDSVRTTSSARMITPAGEVSEWLDDERAKVEVDDSAIGDNAEDDPESEIDWGAASGDEKQELDGAEEKEGSYSPHLHRPHELEMKRTGPHRGFADGERMAPVAPKSPEGNAPSYMALVEAASVHSALDSSTSEHDTSPSEDDGGMMGEILTDRVMEVCSKMESVAPTPADDYSDEDVGRQLTSRSRMSSSSSRNFMKGQVSIRRAGFQTTFFSASTMADYEEKGGDSDDEGSVINDGAAARKLRRDRLRKRSRSRRALSSALNVPTDSAGAPINVHIASYNGEAQLLQSYISQGGDIEARDQFQATALMLCAERGHVSMVETLLGAGADVSAVDENGNSPLHLACFYSHREVARLLLSAEDVDVTVRDSEGRTPLHLATDPVIRRVVQGEEVVRMSGDSFNLLEAVEVNDTAALMSFIRMGQEACGYPTNLNAVALAAKRLRLDRQGRGGMTAVHLAAFHGYSDALQIILEAGADANAVCDDGETPLHTACTGGSVKCASLLLDHGANPLATDERGLVPCEKHVAGGRQDMKRLLESKAFQATPANLMALRMDLSEVAVQIDAEEELFVRKGVAIKYLRKALKKKEVDMSRLRAIVDARDVDIRNLRERMESVHRLLGEITVK